MMLTPSLAVLLATTFLLCVVFLCEREVMYQLYTRDYHHVKLLRFGRLMRYPAMLLSGVFMTLCLMQSPAISSLALTVSAMYCLFTQANMLFDYKDYEQAYMRGMFPAVLVAFPLANVLPAPFGHMPVYATGIAAVSALACNLVNRLRLEQDLFALRD